MRRYTKVLFFSLLTVFTTLFLINLNSIKVNALNITLLTPEQYEAHINETIETDDYYFEFDSIIKQYFSEFSILPANYEEIVTGKSNYKILEITPRTYLGDDSSIVSDISSNIDLITDIYKRAVTSKNVIGKEFITNMANFDVDVMTIKQLVDNREDLSGKYDAIIFAAGDYSTEQVLSCTNDYDYSNLQHDKEYVNNVLIYDGYFYNGLYHGYGHKYENGLLKYEGEFKSGQYYGYGKEYDQNGKLLYSGGFINNKKACYGEYYDENGILRYMGQWANDKRQGYGMSFDISGQLEYIGYWSEDIQNPSQANTEILNDITPIKANEILNNYVQKGLPVFISQEALINPNSNLYLYFNNLSTDYSNVFMLDYNLEKQADNIDFYNTLGIMGITELFSTKPNLDIINKPIDYSVNNTSTYKTDDILNYTVSLTNQDNANLLFYLDLNQNEKFENSELTFSYVIQKGDNSFSFKLPNVNNGLLKYKIVAEKDSLQSSYDGTIRVSNGEKEINVLNIVSDMVYTKNSLFEEDLYSLYFQNNGDYKININSCTIKDFSKNSSRYPCSHSHVMNNYDVILLGQDIFDKPLNTLVYNSLQEQIDKGKPIIFTSSVTKGNQKWIDYFADELSLSDYQTDLYKLNNNVDRLQIVNNSNFTLYPFNIYNEDLIVPEDINYAFNEQYQLNLNNSDLVPLMNMYNSSNSNYDRFDSYNNYYYMKKNNVVYLNVGNNSFKPYKDIEHKLLVDAIVNLYVGANPTHVNLDDLFFINTTNSYENTIVDIKDNVDFNFRVLSSDNELFTYKLYVNDNLVQNNVSFNNNEEININFSLQNYIYIDTCEVSKVYVHLDVFDSNNNLQTYGFYLYVTNFKYYIFLERDLNSLINDTYTEVNKQFSIDYKILINSLNFSQIDYADLPKTLTIKNIVYKEIIPDNIIVSNFETTTNELYQKVITKNFGNVTLTLVNNKYVPLITSEINFSVLMTPTEVGTYNLNDSSVTLNGVSSDVETFIFNALEFEAINKLTPDMIQLKSSNGYVFMPFTSSATLKDFFNISSEAKISSVSFNLLSNLDGANTPHFELYVINNVTKIRTLSIGEQQAEIVVQDIYGNVVRKTFTIISYRPIESLYLGDLNSIPLDSVEVELPLEVNPLTDLNNLKYNVNGITVDGKQVIELIIRDNKFFIKPLNIGHADIEIMGYDEFGNKIIVKNTYIVEKITDIRFINTYMSLLVSESISKEELYSYIELNTTEYIKDNIIFTSTNSDVVYFDNNGNLIARNPGLTVIKACLPNDSCSLMVVKVFDNLSTDSGFKSNITIYDESTYNLLYFIRIYPTTLKLSDVTITFEVIDSNNLVSFDPSTNILTTNGVGDITINVSIKQIKKDGTPIEITDSITLTINENVDPNDDGNDNKV